MRSDLEIDQLVTSDERRVHPVRAQALKILQRVIGPEAIPQWLKSQQPAFDDLTAGQALQRDPQRVLRHLQLLESSLDGDEIEGAVAMIDPLQRRSEKETGHVLSILDSIAVEERGVL